MKLFLMLVYNYVLSLCDAMSCGKNMSVVEEGSAAELAAVVEQG